MSAVEVLDPELAGPSVTTAGHRAVGFTVRVTSTEPVDRLWRIVACAVNQSPMYLARVAAPMTLVYPAPVSGAGAAGGSQQVVVCELRLRHGAALLDDATVQRVLTDIGRVATWSDLALVDAGD